MDPLIQERKFVQNKDYLAFQKNRSVLNLSKGDIQSLIIRLEGICEIIVEELEHVCDVWYTDVPGLMPKKELFESYDRLYDGLFKKAAGLFTELPPVLQNILAHEDRAKEELLKALPPPAGLVEQINYPVQALVSQWEGYLYWLCLIRSDLETSLKDAR